MSVSTFEAAFMAALSGLLNDTSIVLAWSRLPIGAPIPGKKDVVLFYAPGGDMESAHDGVTSEEGRVIQVTIFSSNPQDVKNASKSLRFALIGAPGSQSPMIGTLGDGSTIFNIVSHRTDYDTYDNDEKVHQTSFDVMVRMTETGAVVSDPLTGEWEIDGGSF